MSRYEVVIKKVEALKAASLRGVVPTPPDQGRLWKQLEGVLALQRVRPVGARFSLYYDEEYKEQDWDIANRDRDTDPGQESIARLIVTHGNGVA